MNGSACGFSGKALAVVLTGVLSAGLLQTIFIALWVSRIEAAVLFVRHTVDAMERNVEDRLSEYDQRLQRMEAQDTNPTSPNTTRTPDVRDNPEP